jgi:hypothetical protein
MVLVPATITTELMEHTDGRPVAYIDATAVAVFAYQQPNGTYIIDICTREGLRPGRRSLVLDGQAIYGSAATSPVVATGR